MMRGYGYYGGMMGGGWWDILMVVFWLIVLAALIVLVVWIVRQMSGGGHWNAGHGPQAPPSARDDACETVRLRYAKGEITKEEYEEICKTLGV